MSRTTSDILWATFRHLGADCVFGVPGSQTIGLFQALEHSSLRTIVPTHELAASFMAAGYARVSGRPGIISTIPGPGFTYALTGVAEARLDSVPLVLIVPAALESGSHEHLLQAIDQRAIAGTLVKQIVRLDRASDAMAAAAEAYHAAAAGEPGPVMLEIGPGVMGAPAQPRAIPPSRPVLDPPAAGIEALVDRLDRAPRVLLYLGAGAVDATDAVRTMVRTLGAAVVTTTSGRGIVPEDDPAIVIRDTGLGCQNVLNALAGQADLVVALGCKFSHNGAAGFALSIDPRRLVTVNTGGPSRNYPAHLHLTGDVSQVLARVLPRLSQRDSMVGGWNRAELAGLRADSDARQELPDPHVSGMPATAADVVRDLAGSLPSDAIVVTDSGLHQMCVRRHLRVRAPRGLIVPANFQSMGFALPAAIGAALATPGRRVVAILGDGGMMMSALELATAVRERIDLTVVVFNDAAYGLIRHAQLVDYGASHGTELSNPDFGALANALGAEYRSCVPDGVAAAIGARASRTGVRLIEIPLQDAPSMRRVRALGVARRMARGMLPTRGGRTIRRWLKRYRFTKTLPAK